MMNNGANVNQADATTLICPLMAAVQAVSFFF